MPQSALINKDTPGLPTRWAARATLPSAALLGIAGQQLLQQGPTGLGWVVWMALFGCSSVMIVRQARFEWQLETTLAAALAVAASVVFSVRASEAFYAMGMIVLISVASIPLLRARSVRFGATPLAMQIFGCFMVGLHAAGGALFLNRAAGFTARPATHVRGKIGIATRGALLAVPPLVVFGALFVNADPLFERYVGELTHFVSEDLAARLLMMFVFAWIAAGMLRGLLPAQSELPPMPQAPSLPVGEITVALGAVAALFTAFVAVQAQWLFNGASALAAINGLTAADYARRGFFELVAASALTLPLLLAADSVTHTATARGRRIMRLLSGSIVLLVLVIMGSALQRMALYTNRFGLTEDRVYATAFMAWLGVVFTWFVITTLRGRRNRFAAGPVAAGIAAYFALAIANPDALIARVNLDRARHGAEVDASYLTQLSADAAPVLHRHLDNLPPDARCHIAKKMLGYAALEQQDWRSANFSVVKARELAQDNATRLTQIKLQECKNAKS